MPIARFACQRAGRHEVARNPAQPGSCVADSLRHPSTPSSWPERNAVTGRTIPTADLPVHCRQKRPLPVLYPTEVPALRPESRSPFPETSLFRVLYRPVTHPEGKLRRLQRSASIESSAVTSPAQKSRFPLPVPPGLLHRPAVRHRRTGAHADSACGFPDISACSWHESGVRSRIADQRQPEDAFLVLPTANTDPQITAKTARCLVVFRSFRRSLTFLAERWRSNSVTRLRQFSSAVRKRSLSSPQKFGQDL